MGRCISPVRPTFLRHMKQRFFLGLGASVGLVSALTAVFTEEEEEAVGWVTTEEVICISFITPVLTKNQ